MLEKFSTNLSQNSYDSILKKGFCLLLSETGKLVKSCKIFEENKMTSVTAKFHDGDVIFSGITSNKS
jgi:exonuclease VII large subunit